MFCVYFSDKIYAIYIFIYFTRKRRIIIMFRKAERRKAKLRLAITGPAGSGKTYGALLIAQGLGGKIAMIDTENGSGDLYADMCDYDVQTLTAPYSIQKYLEAIHEAEQEGYDVLIIDSLSHAWSGEGGLLDVHSKLTSTSKSGNSYAAWNKITPMQNRLIETMLASKCHVIATMRSKTDYAIMQSDKGRAEIRKVGLAPVQRDGVDYEFTVVFDLSMEHTVTVSKDRTSLFDKQVFEISSETGKILSNWLNSGSDPVLTAQDIRSSINRLYYKYLELFGNDQGLAQAAMQNVTDGRASKDWTEEDINNLTEDLKLRSLKIGESEDIVIQTQEA